MQYEIVFKSDRMFMLYLPSSKFSCCCSKASEDGGSWYSSDGSTSTHDRNAKTWSTHAHTYQQWQKIKTVQQYSKTAHKANLKLFYASQRSRERENQSEPVSLAQDR
jgi:hypothetical protein